jgi:uncharacterized protein
MQAIFSRNNLNDNSPLMRDLQQQLADLLHHPMVLKLDHFSQHLHTSRLQHSFNVSYYSYRFSRWLGYDVRATVRAALLHDLFLYEWRTEQPIEGSHIDVHPQIALETAQSITEVSPLMADIIRAHMWPLGQVRPQSKEAYLVQAMDKLATLLEVAQQLRQRSLKPALASLWLTFIFLVR